MHHQPHWKSIGRFLAALSLGLYCGNLLSASELTHVQGEALQSELENIDGSLLRPLLSKESDPGSVVIFTTVDCPIANAYQPQIARLYQAYGPEGQGFRFSLIHVDPSVNAETAHAHAKDYKIPCPIALDPDHELVGVLSATITPQAFVVLPDGTIAYQGRINDWYDDLGKRRRQPRVEDLKNALDAILAGKKIAVTQTEAIGCYIEDFR